MTLQAYYDIDNEQVLVTDNKTAWRATTATLFTSIYNLLAELADLNTAISITQRHRRYSGMLVGIASTFPSFVHYHSTQLNDEEGREEGREEDPDGGRDGGRDVVMTFKDHGETILFAHESPPSVTRSFFQCCGEECNNLNNPPLMPRAA